MTVITVPRTHGAIERVTAYLDYLLSYPLGVGAIARIGDVTLRPVDVRMIVSGRDTTGVAAAAVRAFLDQFEPTGREVIDDRPDHELTVTDLRAVLADPAAGAREPARATTDVEDIARWIGAGD